MTRTLRLIIAALTFQMASRGLDYILGNTHSGVGVFQTDGFGATFAWGATCLVAAIIITVGLIGKSDQVVRAGALLSTAIYLAFALMVTDDVFKDGSFDDWRYLTLYLSAAFIWAVIAWALTIRMAVSQHREETSAD